MTNYLQKGMLTAALLLCMVTNIHAVTISKYLSTTTQIAAIERVEPKYPRDAARNRREGWVVLSCTITEEGDVENVKLVSSSGSKDFEKSATKALRRWKYHPLIENGVPVKQNVKTIQLNFYMADKPTIGVSRKFRRNYDKAITALDNKDYKTFAEYIQKIKGNRKMHLSENNYLQLLLAGYAESRGDKPKQLSHLIRVKNSLARLSTGSEKLSVLYQTFTLQADLSQFNAAYNTYFQLQKLPEAEPYMDKFDAAIKQIDTLIGSDKNLIQTAKIDGDYWQTELSRKSFSLTGISGELSKLSIRCANKTHSYTIENDNTWTIPSSWKSCDVFLYGKNGSSFKLIEHPFKSVAEELKS